MGIVGSFRGGKAAET